MVDWCRFDGDGNGEDDDDHHDDTNGDNTIIVMATVVMTTIMMTMIMIEDDGFYKLPYPSASPRVRTLSALSLPGRAHGTSRRGAQEPAAAGASDVRETGRRSLALTSHYLYISLLSIYVAAKSKPGAADTFVM